MFRKIEIDQSQEFPYKDGCVLRVSKEDGPNYPLLEFKGFGSRPVKDIKPTTANYPRKVETIQDKLTALIASTANFMWMVFGWPISLYLKDDGTEEQFDHRHLLRALITNNWVHAPVVLYVKKITGNNILDNLTDNSRMTLSGLYVNASDGTANAKMKDFYIISKIMEDEKIPRTKKNVELLMQVAGVNVRFPNANHDTTRGTIRNAIIENKKRSQRVFNTAKSDYQEWVAAHPFFGLNNRSKQDNVLTYHKVLDESFTYRYANDILKWTFSAWLKGERVRVCASSKAECEVQIETDREEMVTAIKSILDTTINWYISWVEDRMKAIMPSFGLPKVELEQLPLDLWWIPQIDGEDKDKAIKVDLS
tara:strand:+ start:141 stop:1235 length:1095 start_codon:yes stop_codon:yes gene_type:complete